jgi:hypothetical protein
MKSSVTSVCTVSVFGTDYFRAPLEILGAITVDKTSVRPTSDKLWFSLLALVEEGDSPGAMLRSDP